MQVEVAVPLPILKTFSYALPPEFVEQAVPGARVLVPFAGRERVGWIDRVAPGDGGPGSRPITAVLDSTPSITPELLRLCRWTANYYFASLGLVLRAALPAALSATATQTIELVRMGGRGEGEAASDGRRPGRAGVDVLETGGNRDVPTTDPGAPVAAPTASVADSGASVAYPAASVSYPAASDADPGSDTDPGSDAGALAAPDAEVTELERLVLDWLASVEGPQSVTRLRRENGDRAWWPVIRRLEQKGLLRVRSEPPRVEPPLRTRRVLRLTRELPTLSERDAAFGRAKRQRECWEWVESVGGEAEVARLVGQQGFSYAVLNGLVAKGLARIEEEEVARDPYAEIAPAHAPRIVPTARQRAAIDELVRAARGDRPGTYLIRGVTGSGKTLVYIELLREVVERQGRTAIVLVPEIALTPQTVGRFRAVFGDRVAVLHSALSDGERYDEWRALRSGAKRIAVGARSAVFAPLPKLGAIIVDEEHEATYKQSEAPRYHARELAVVRASLEGAICVLGSATPSLESWVNAQTGKYRLIELPERATGQALPVARVVDLRQERKKQRDGRLSGGPVILSEELRDSVQHRLERGEQTILLLNRRGYANFVQCGDCGNVWDCPSCAVSLTFHRRRARLTCHYCLYEEEPPTACARCASSDIIFRGIGTEQVERAVEEAFPAARLARMDVDTTSARWSHHKILDRVERGDVDILLGTQMIAKGLDFPNVTLVGVINADVGLNLPDFRATERTFQLITQVAGRAGRGPKGGEVIIQTSRPKHYAIECSLAHDFPGFAQKELEARQDPSYPPFSRLVNVIISGLDEIATQDNAQRAADWLRGLARKRAITDLEIIGPAPAPIERIRDRWRWHLLMRSGSPVVIGRVGAFFAERFRLPGGKADLRLAIDRDPVALL